MKDPEMVLLKMLDKIRITIICWFTGYNPKLNAKPQTENLWLIKD